MGQTSRRLEERIKEHVPRSVRVHYAESPNEDYKQSGTLVRAAKRSSIAEHLLQNKACGEAYEDSWFRVLRRCRNRFHLHVLEAVLITTLSPSLCKQKEFDYVCEIL